MSGPVRKFSTSNKFNKEIANSPKNDEMDCLNEFLRNAKTKRFGKNEFYGNWPGLLQIYACGHIMYWSVNARNEVLIQDIQRAPSLP